MDLKNFKKRPKDNHNGRSEHTIGARIPREHYNLVNEEGLEHAKIIQAAYRDIVEQILENRKKNTKN